ncbi:MAG: NAD(P)-binding protein [Desulfofustis sp.]|nr:NAD(P)-binding protein [Desulfofustis sp.]
MEKQAMHEVVIIGAGLAGLSCARVLQKHNVGFTLLEKADRPGGRIKTDRVNGYLLDHGFQVLQTGYPDISKYLNLQDLKLSSFPSGVAIRHNKKFHVIADPRRHPLNFYSTLAAPIGSVGDRFKLLKLAGSLARHPMEHIFDGPEEPTMAFLTDWGFSSRFIKSFFTPFFSGACLDPSMQGSSRVLKYVTRLFATGDAVLPAEGMGAIPNQIAASLPAHSIRYNHEATKVEDGQVTLVDGSIIEARYVVVAVSQPVCARILNIDAPVKSVAEACVYFSSDWRPPLNQPFLVLNGEGSGPVNNIAFPSLVAPTYAPTGKTLIAAVVLGEEFVDNHDLENLVRQQLAGWFGAEVQGWEHIKTLTIHHALPRQAPPTSNPYRIPQPYSDGIRICGEHQSLPGLLWALMSGEMAGFSLAESTKSVVT